MSRVDEKDIYLEHLLQGMRTFVFMAYNLTNYFDHTYVPWSWTRKLECRTSQKHCGMSVVWCTLYYMCI